MNEGSVWNSGKANHWRPEEPPDKKDDSSRRPIEIFKREAQAFIDRFQVLFQTISGDSSLRYEVGDGFYIDLKQGVITLDVKDFLKLKEGGLSLWQIVWSVAHEIGHFHDLREHPEGMMKHFSYMEDRAKELAPEALAIIHRKHGDEVAAQMQAKVPYGDPKEGKTKTALEVFLYRKFHLLYNSLDDMYVNRLLAERAPVFAPHGNAGADVEHLYRTYLFPSDPSSASSNLALASTEAGSTPVEVTPDYRKLPKSHQLAYALLRKRMVPTEDVLIADDVYEILEGYPSQTAKRFGLNIRSLVETWTTPGVNGKKKHEVSGVDEPCERDPAWRYARFKEKVEPAFVKLLMEDLENLEAPPLPSEGKDSQGSDSDQQPSDQSPEYQGGKPKDQDKEKKGKKPSVWDELDQKPEHLDPENTKKFVKDKKEKDKQNTKATADKEKAKNASPEELQAQAQAEADRALCQNANVDPKAAEEYRKIEREIELYKHELARVFEEFMRTIEERVTSYLITGFKTGKEDIRYLIRKYAPELAQNEDIPFDPSNLDHHARLELISRLSIYPNDFRVRFVVDGSGSMAGKKIEMARKITVLLLEGLGTFEEMMNLRYRLQKPFHADTQVRVFGDEDTLAKSFKADDPQAHGLVAKFKALEEVKANKGSTHDAPSFKAIDKSLDTDRAKKLLEGKARELVIYIADGGSQTAEESKRAIEAIRAKGATCKGLLIGTASEDIQEAEEKESRKQEEKTFDTMFGVHGRHISDVSKLAEVILELLDEEIQTTAVRVSAYEDTSSDDEI